MAEPQKAQDHLDNVSFGVSARASQGESN